MRAITCFTSLNPLLSWSLLSPSSGGKCEHYDAANTCYGSNPPRFHTWCYHPFWIQRLFRPASPAAVVGKVLSLFFIAFPFWYYYISKLDTHRISLYPAYHTKPYPCQLTFTLASYRIMGWNLGRRVFDTGKLRWNLTKSMCMLATFHLQGSAPSRPIASISFK